MILLHKCLELFKSIWIVNWSTICCLEVCDCYVSRTNKSSQICICVDHTVKHVPECTSSYGHWSSGSKHAKWQLIMGYVNAGFFFMEFCKTLDLILLCWNLLIRKAQKKLWQRDEGPSLCMENFNCHAIAMERHFVNFLLPLEIKVPMERILLITNYFRATLDKGSRSKVQWNQAFLLVTSFKLVPRHLDEGPGPRQVKLWFSLYGISLEGWLQIF